MSATAFLYSLPTSGTNVGEAIRSVRAQPYLERDIVSPHEEDTRTVYLLRCNSMRKQCTEEWSYVSSLCLISVLYMARIVLSLFPLQCWSSAMSLAVLVQLIVSASPALPPCLFTSRGQFAYLATYWNPHPFPSSISTHRTALGSTGVPQVLPVGQICVFSICNSGATCYCL